MGLISGLVTGIVTWPLAPVRGLLWVGEQIEEEAERQWNDPSLVRQQLDDLDARRQTGELTPEEADALEDALVQRLLDAGGGAADG
jgi:hypothetical protein